MTEETNKGKVLRYLDNIEYDLDPTLKTDFLIYTYRYGETLQDKQVIVLFRLSTLTITVEGKINWIQETLEVSDITDNGGEVLEEAVTIKNFVNHKLLAYLKRELEKQIEAL